MTHRYCLQIYRLVYPSAESHSGTDTLRHSRRSKEKKPAYITGVAVERHCRNADVAVCGKEDI